MTRPGLLGVALALALLSPTLRADVPPAASGVRGLTPEQRQAFRQHIREGLRSAPSALLAPSGMPAPSGVPASSGVPLQLDPQRAELLRKWAVLVATRTERRQQHRAELVKEVGQRLSDPDVKAELALHATRVADLARIQFLAQNARSGAERDKALARVGKLSAREAERHRKRLAKLLAAPAPGPAAAPSGAQPAATPAPSAEAPR